LKPIIIIGGGWSVSKYDVRDLRKYGFVIGVNESAVLCKVDVGITMDRLWAENRFRQFMLENPSADLWVRDGADKALPTHPRLRKFFCDHKSVIFSDDPYTFNGTNSGACAISFAAAMRPSKIFLFGFDMQKGPKGEPYWYPPYPWTNLEGGTKPGKYVKWAEQFWEIAGQLKRRNIETFSVTNSTAIKAFPRLSFDEFQSLAQATE
jgi:hypothetical protein